MCNQSIILQGSVILHITRIAHRPVRCFKYYIYTLRPSYNVKNSSTFKYDGECVVSNMTVLNCALLNSDMTVLNCVLLLT